MSPPITTANPTVEMPKLDCVMNRNFKFAGTFDFTSTSSNAGRFDYPKLAPEIPNSTGRIKPRLMKMRKKQVGASRDVLKSQGADLGVDRFTGCSDEFKTADRSEKVFMGCIQDSGSNTSKVNGDLNGNLKHFGARDPGFNLGSGYRSSVFGHSTNSSASIFPSKYGENMFDSNRSSPNLDASSKNNTFVFGDSKTGTAGNLNSQSLNSMPNSSESQLRKDVNDDSAGFVFCVGKSDHGMYPIFTEKEPSGNFRQLNVGESLKFDPFCSDKNGSSSNVNLDQRNSNICGWEQRVAGFEKSESANFVFGACNSGSGYDIGKVNVNYVFGSNNFGSKINTDLQNIPICQNVCKFDTKDKGKENTGIGTVFQNNVPSNVFTFRGLKNKEVFGTEGSDRHVKETDQLNRVNAEHCNSGFVEDNHEIGSLRHSNFTSNSVNALLKDPAFKLCDEMKRLNVDGFGDDTGKTKKFNDSIPDYTNAPIFGRTIYGSVRENDPIDMSGRTPNTSYSLHDNIGLSKPSSFFTPARNSDFVEITSTSKDENDGTRFTSKLSGLYSDDKNFSMPKLKFSISSVDKVENSKSTRIKRFQKESKRLRQKTIIQKLPSQDHVPKEDSYQQTHEPIKCGSPMDFSPCQNSVSKSLSEAIDASTEGEPAVNKNDFTEYDGNLNISSSLPTQDGLSAIRKQYRKKYKLKFGSDETVQVVNIGKENAKKDIKGLEAHEICEDWRIRGNQAYHVRKFSQAEEFYSMGINSISHASNLGCSKKPFLLCYSNRAATRMTLGRMREAIGDCKLAAALDPSFSKVTLRAGNCYLILGEVEDAINCYTKCLELGTGLCLDRRITIEATDGIQKANRVSNFMLEFDRLLLEGTHDAVRHALGSITDAFSISRYSERLLEMKGRAFCILRMYDEVIQLCEQTLDIAEKNFTVDHSDDRSCKHSRVRMWRWYLQSKSHYHLGRLDMALDLLEQQEKLPTATRSEDATQESSIALASSVRELLNLKRSGNEAFHSGKFAEAIEHYTIAISKSLDSRPFMAICFCNRAAAYQSTNQIVDAIADCSLAIALDENYQKAISRRATLYEMIRDYKQTSYDLQKLSSLLEIRSPENDRQNASQNRSRGSANIRDLRKARNRLSKIEEKAKKEIQMDFYLILGIKASDTESEIKKAYRKAALRHHPDKASQVFVRSDVGDNGTLWKEVGEKVHADADKLFKIIGEAYAVLSDSSKRAKYDMEEDIRNVFKDSNMNSQSGRQSTSYNSPFERGSWSERQTGNASSSERNAGRRHWHDQWRRHNF